MLFCAFLKVRVRCGNLFDPECIAQFQSNLVSILKYRFLLVQCCRQQRCDTYFWHHLEGMKKDKTSFSHLHFLWTANAAIA